MLPRCVRTPQGFGFASQFLVFLVTLVGWTTFLTWPLMLGRMASLQVTPKGKHSTLRSTSEFHPAAFTQSLQGVTFETPPAFWKVTFRVQPEFGGCHQSFAVVTIWSNKIACK